MRCDVVERFCLAKKGQRTKKAFLVGGIGMNAPCVSCMARVFSSLICGGHLENAGNYVEGDTHTDHHFGTLTNLRVVFQDVAILSKVLLTVCKCVSITAYAVYLRM